MGEKISLWRTNNGKVGLNCEEIKNENIEYEIVVKKIVYPLSGYGNNYIDMYCITLERGKKYGKVELRCVNNTWARGGHGMNAAWTEVEGYLNRETIEQIRKLAKELNEIKSKDEAEFAVRFKEYFNEIWKIIEDNLIVP